MYVKYNAVLRGLVTGANRYAATIYLVCSGLRKLSRTNKLPEGLMVYRGNGGMALPLDFLEPDAQVYLREYCTHFTLPNHAGSTTLCTHFTL